MTDPVGPNILHAFADAKTFASLTKKGALFHKLPVTTVMRSHSEVYPKLVAYLGVIANGGTIVFVVRTTTAKAKLARVKMNKKVGEKMRQTVTVAEVVTKIINKAGCPNLQEYNAFQLGRVIKALAITRGNIKAANALLTAGQPVLTAAATAVNEAPTKE
jgi:hypothetical protein